MQRKSKLALAVLSALALPGLALAQDAAGKDKSKLKGVLSTVELELYGKLYPEFVTVSHSGASAPTDTLSTLAGASTGVNPTNFNGLATSNSRVGIRGQKTLGSGLTASAQLEYKISIDSSGTNLSTRNSFVGLDGGFGTVKLGVMDTVYKDIGDKLSFLGVSSGNFVSNSSVLSKLGFAKAGKGISSTGGSFHLRQPNSIRYDSPKFGGAQLHLQYAPDEAKSANTNAELWSTGVSYKTKSLYLALAHEIHNDLYGASKNLSNALSNTAGSNIPTVAGVHSKDHATRGTVGYNFGQGTKVEVNLASLKWSESGPIAAGKFTDYKKTSYSLNVQQKFGKLTAQASYANSSDGSCTLAGGRACSTTGLKANQLNLGVSYALPEAELFALYSRLNNGASSKFDNRENDRTVLESGTDVNQFAVGVSFSF